jgi:Fe-S-cluster containining protein
MSDRPAVLRKLQKIYDGLPTIDCQRKCGFSNCGPVKALKIENRNIIEGTGRALQFPLVQIGELTCPHLSEQGDCTIYEFRPIICRLFGLVDERNMKCPWGCVPSRWLSKEEGGQIMRQVYDLKI